jgi:hypothetical protein
VRALVAEVRSRPAAPGSRSDERRKKALSRSARAHGLVEYWAAWSVPEAQRPGCAALGAALRSAARAALAQSAAEERSWPGAPALVTRLWDDAERALSSLPSE